MKSVPVHLKKLSDVASKETVKNTKFNKLNTKVYNSANKIPDAITKRLEKKIEAVDKKVPGASDLVTTTVLDIKIGKVKNKIPDPGKDVEEI